MGVGINFLYDEYRKDPNRVEKLLSEKIEISEKLDASRFFAQLVKKGEFSYFKRKDVPITKIDRTLSRYYEKAIYHFENLPEEKLEMFPDNWRFGMKYFPNLQPVTISYDRLPLNHLVLTDIQVKDPRDKTLEVITDKDTLFKWAEILEVEKPPIIFEGTLNDSQKRKILDFLNTPYSSLIDRFKTENFTHFILSLLNPELKNSFLNNNLEKDIDGLIFKFNGKEAYRISNPEIAISKSKKREDKPSDIYNLTLVILQEFMISIDFKKIKLKQHTFEDRYIEFISKVFNIFVKSPYYQKNFTGDVDFELPRFLTRQEAGVNFQFVQDEETKKLLDESNTNRELFKILMASMRSKKKKPSGFFSKELIQHHNTLVDKIADYINSNLKESFLTYEEFKSVFLDESNSTWQEFGKEELEEDECIESINEQVFSAEGVFPSFKHITKSQEYDVIKPSVDVLKRMYTEEPISDKKTSEVCLMKGKFFPFHNGHIASIKDARKESGKKVFVVILTSRSENVISKDLHRTIMDEVVKNEKDVIGYEFSDGRSLNEIKKNLDVKIKSYSGNSNECEDVSLQDPEIITIPATRHMGSDSVIKKIKDEDYEGYKKLVPVYLHNYFYKIKNELK